MVFSGLFEHIFVPQVQVVGYIHQWNPNEKELSEIGGNFIYWGDKKNVNTHNTKGNLPKFNEYLILTCIFLTCYRWKGACRL
mmetsp:Transcript_3837/g.4424  ORF Transcript_3837/g.4424 Transcript_3837/m.4424 type:complete len:82 (+) Transcript_3837:17-262(+)